MEQELSAEAMESIRKAKLAESQMSSLGAMAPEVNHQQPPTLYSSTEPSRIIALSPEQTHHEEKKFSVL